MCGTCGCGAKTQATILNLETGAETTLDGHVRSHTQDDGSARQHEHSRPHAHPHDHGADHVHARHHNHDHMHDHEHLHDHEHGDHDHQHDHRHDHDDGHARSSVIELEAQILAKNDALAAKNRGWFLGREILALNLVSSPGAGKTTLLERTIRDLKDKIPISVIEGDQATSKDGERIRAAGAAAVQINTGAGCHLEADMVEKGLAELKPPFGSMVMIENVGNLVCPALFDLGESAKVVILSVTEGDDKPLKYPHMFKAAEIMIVNKVDLLPHVDFDVGAAIDNAMKVNPAILALRVSARTGEGLDDWYAWLDRRARACRL
ncbi:hydrogenase accessory protein HypB [Methylocella silvestris BL2]|uniref:Hydrogenase maturation factor HypB n=1 Tax=Methylocella silvestris (strain DSM 15510 / CIP 108128 / LMG 27833 / NCIMB 13906 / BL2) TaxID=395965 RepID=B8EJD8_METSB|nr:hydrogenase nickel incorporation protein HypB [Methylocella silvestris]ACK52630.1 hydrogenase accessory protein HypB [Methylocella silvestris BL2]